MGEVGKALGRNFGGMPAWAWLGLFAVAMILYRTLRRPPATLSADGTAAASESSGPTVPIILAPLQTSTRTVVVGTPPGGPGPRRPHHLSAAGSHAWDALATWWASGGTGSPPDASGLTQDRERAAYDAAFQWYVEHPVGTAPPGVLTQSGYSVQVIDPTTDGVLE